MSDNENSPEAKQVKPSTEVLQRDMAKLTKDVKITETPNGVPRYLVSSTQSEDSDWT